MVPEEGVARLSLGGHAIGLCGAAPGFRAPCPPGTSPDFSPVGGVVEECPRPAARRPKPVRPPWTGSAKRLVPEEGVAPSRPCGHGILSPARLPVPPLRRRWKKLCISFIHAGTGKSKSPRGIIHGDIR